jgi:hypothetical protein
VGYVHARAPARTHPSHRDDRDRDDGGEQREDGDFSWAFPPEDVHRAANEATAGTGIHLLGRRTYELMRYWDEPRQGMSEVELEFHPAWAPAQKVVYPRSIDEVGPNARIERESTRWRRRRLPMHPILMSRWVAPIWVGRRCGPALWMCSRSCFSR